jgi:hypothetical protein
MEAMRQSWSDDRLDLLNQRVVEGFRLADESSDRIEKSIDDLRSEIRQRSDATDRRLDHVEQRLYQLLIGILVVGGGLIGALILTIAGLITSLS